MTQQHNGSAIYQQVVVPLGRNGEALVFPDGGNIMAASSPQNSRHVRPAYDPI